MIRKNRHVKIVFKNGIQIEGISQEFGKDSASIRSLTDDSEIFIMHPSEDIMFVKMMPEVQDDTTEPEQEEIQVEENQPTQPMSPAEAINQIQIDDFTDQNLRLQKLAELRLAAAQQERKIVAEKIKDHTVTEVRSTQYGIPGFFKKQNTK